MTVYRVEMILRKEGDKTELSRKLARLYTDDLECSEYALHIRSIEIIRDMQYRDNPQIDPTDFYKRYRMYP